MRKLHPHQEIVGLRGLTVEDFWIWAYSDLLTNVTRNAFAEFMVGFALARLHTPRIGLEPSLFEYRDKLVAVRAAAYTQSEPQIKPSKINFNISAPKPAGADKPREPDCFVFCLFSYEHFKDKDGARDAMLNTEYWSFYVVPQKVIQNAATGKKTLGVSWMQENTPGGPVTFSQLRFRVDDVLGLQS